MNQRQALTLACSKTGMYKFGNNWKVYGPWKDSNINGPTTDSSHAYYNNAQSALALRKAELALWQYLDNNDERYPCWRDFFIDVCFAMRIKHESGPATARGLLAYGVQTIGNYVKKGVCI